MKIYIVTSGSYSDYTIEGVFSTRDLAQGFIREARFIEDLDELIEEWELDARTSERRMTVWQCGIFLDTGEIVELHSYIRMRTPFRGEISAEAIPVPMYEMRKVTRVRSGVSAEHAKKLAVEARQAWLRKEAFEPEGVEE